MTWIAQLIANLAQRWHEQQTRHALTGQLWVELFPTVKARLQAEREVQHARE